ncbi:MAG: type II toxin-antitoxin system RelE/ParE family toxin [Ignavibacteriae bacterium]|nr:type II toxin-antitoxin system RelE/ParE family toxin [Ignavibacteriota bacterium]
MARVVWTTPALADVQQIIEYISNDSQFYAERVGTRIVQAPRRLKQFPLSGRIVPEFSDNNIREIIYGAYRIIYQTREDVCCIVAVIHGSRNLLLHVNPDDWVLQ